MVWAVASWLIPLIVTVLVTPFFVRALGAENYGVYSLVTGVIGYALTPNLARATIKFVSEYKARDLPQEIDRVIAASLILNAVIVLAGALGLLLAARFVTVDVLRVAEHLQTDTITSFRISGVFLLCVLFGLIYSAILQAFHQFKTVSRITIAINVLLAVGNVILAAQHFSVVWLVWWTIATSALGWLLFFRAARISLRSINSSAVPLKVDFSQLLQTGLFRRMLSYGASVGAYQILGNSLFLFERGLVTRVAGVDGLTFYAVPMTLAICIHGFASSFASVLFPATTELIARAETNADDQRRLLSLYTRATKYSTTAIAFIVGSAAANGSEFLRLWMGADFAERASWILFWHVLTFGFLAATIIAWQLIESYGAPYYNSIWTGVWVFISAAVMLFLSSEYQSDGIAFARFAGIATLGGWLILVERRVFGRFLRRFWLNLILQIGLSTIIAVVIEKFVSRNLPLSWAWFAASVTLGAIGFAVAAALSGLLTADERRLGADFLRRRFFAHK